jgi:hypothetical protein
MKWELVKQKVADQVCSMVAQGRTMTAEMLVDLVRSDFEVLRRLPEAEKWHGPIREAYAAEVRKCIEAWDIRCVGSLRDLFPWAFPPSLLKKPLTAEYDDQGDWCVHPS